MSDAMDTVKPDHPAFEEMRLAIKVLATDPGPIHARLQAAVPHFGVVHESKMRTPAEEHLRMRIGSGLVEGGSEDEASDVETDVSDAEVAESVALLDEARAVEIAGDMLCLYELLGGRQAGDDSPELSRIRFSRSPRRWHSLLRLRGVIRAQQNQNLDTDKPTPNDTD